MFSCGSESQKKTTKEVGVVFYNRYSEQKTNFPKHKPNRSLHKDVDVLRAVVYWRVQLSHCCPWKRSSRYLHAASMRSAGYPRPAPVGVVQRQLVFVVVVQAQCTFFLLFLFEHCGDVQCPTLHSSSSNVQMRSQPYRPTLNPGL